MNKLTISHRDYNCIETSIQIPKSKEITMHYRVLKSCTPLCLLIYWQEAYLVRQYQLGTPSLCWIEQQGYTHLDL